MLQKDKIISTALRKIGQVQDYNDNRSDIYKIASITLDDIIKSLASSRMYLFNATETKLSKTGRESVRGENEYNRPADMLNLIQASDDFRLQGEFIYSNSDNLAIQYCRDISLTEIPDDMEDLIIYKLAVDMCEENTSFVDRLPLVNTRFEQARREVFMREGLPAKMEAI